MPRALRRARAERAGLSARLNGIAPAVAACARIALRARFAASRTIPPISTTRRRARRAPGRGHACAAHGPRRAARDAASTRAVRRVAIDRLAADSHRRAHRCRRDARRRRATRRLRARRPRRHDLRAELTALVARARRDGLQRRDQRSVQGRRARAQHGRPAERRHSLQIEIKRTLYMDEATLEPTRARTLERDLERLATCATDGRRSARADAIGRPLDRFGPLPTSATACGPLPHGAVAHPQEES